MKLAEDKQVVEALKKILDDYDYLEYDEIMSGCSDTLNIKVTDLDAKRDEGVKIGICLKLEEATSRKFSAFHSSWYKDSDNFSDVWDNIVIREDNQ